MSKSITLPENPYLVWDEPAKPLIQELTPFILRFINIVQRTNDHTPDVVQRKKQQLRESSRLSTDEVHVVAEQIDQIERVAQEAVRLIFERGWFLYEAEIKPRIDRLIETFEECIPGLESAVEQIETAFVSQYGAGTALANRLETIKSQIENLKNAHAQSTSGPSTDRLAGTTLLTIVPPKWNYQNVISSPLLRYLHQAVHASSQLQSAKAAEPTEVPSTAISSPPESEDSDEGWSETVTPTAKPGPTRIIIEDDRQPRSGGFVPPPSWR